MYFANWYLFSRGSSTCLVLGGSSPSSASTWALKSQGPHFICAQVEALDGERPPKTKHVLDPRENKYQFAKYIERTEGVQILGGGLGNFG